MIEVKNIRSEFAAELERMLQEMPLEKVRVTHLCQRVGATPPAFYYHFQDKYELVAWIYVRDFVEVFADRNPDYSADLLDKSMARMESRRDFYIAVFTDRSQNSIAEYFQEFNLKLARDAVRFTTGQKDLTDDQMLELKHHSYGLTGLFMEWLAAGSRIPRMKLATFLAAKTPLFLQKAFAGYPYSGTELMALVERRNR